MINTLSTLTFNRDSQNSVSQKSNAISSSNFDEVLQQTGAEQSSDAPQGIPEEVRIRWKSRGISDESIHKFQEIVFEAKNHVDIQTFFSQMNHEQLAIINEVSGLAEDLTKGDIASLSEEAARNLVVWPDNRGFVDLNNDGIVEHGKAKLLVMPPPNSPEEVKVAWEKATEGLTLGEKMLKESIFLTQSLMANIRQDENGKASVAYPGDEDYVNIFPTSTEGWTKLLAEMKEQLEGALTRSRESEERLRLKEEYAFLNLLSTELV